MASQLPKRLYVQPKSLENYHRRARFHLWATGEVGSKAGEFSLLPMNFFKA